jgi:ubiquinone biosynthesis protein UbiJ
MLTQAIENLLNRNLPRSPRALQLCEQLKGKTLRVDARPLGWTLRIEALGSSIRLEKAAGDTPADASISGSLLSLAALAGPAPEDIIRRGDVTISGDAEIAQRFRELAMLLKPDVEEELSRLIGDTPAHQALKFARAAAGFGRRAFDTGVRNTAEYFAHESRDLISKPEAEDFYRGVEALRSDLDRLEARVRLLEPKESENPR